MSYGSGHMCDNYSCPEYNQGKCFGGGCWRNPAKPSDEENEEEKQDEEL